MNDKPQTFWRISHGLLEAPFFFKRRKKKVLFATFRFIINLFCCLPSLTHKCVNFKQIIIYLCFFPNCYSVNHVHLFVYALNFYWISILVGKYPAHNILWVSYSVLWVTQYCRWELFEDDWEIVLTFKKLAIW